MKKTVDIRNESGFGLIHVLAVTLIVSIAILGLFMSIEYARRQADVNYHSRSAMLIAQGYLEEFKYNNRSTGIYSRPNVRTGTETVRLEDYNGKVTTATVTISSSTSGNPYSVSGLPNTYRDEIKVKVSWKEKPTASMSSIQNKQHSVMLKEDYYWKRSQTSVL
jgi:Tfp pilus assembly protein PilV